MAFAALKNFILNNYNDTSNGDCVYKEIYNETTGAKQYSIRFSEKNDVIVLTMRKIYNNSWTYASTYLTPEKQTYYSGFSYYDPLNTSNTPDFDASYAIYANSFGENTVVRCQEVNGDKKNHGTFEELA